VNEDSNANKDQLGAGIPASARKVQIIHRVGNEVAHPNCLVVSPYRENTETTELLATVEHFIKHQDPSGFPWKIVPITQSGVILKTAMVLALDYASKNDIPVILVNQEEFSTDVEKQQTDTKMIQVKS